MTITPLPLRERISSLVAFGKSLKHLIESDDFAPLAHQAYLYNNWFTEPNVLLSLSEAALQLSEENLFAWVQPHNFASKVSKRVGVVAAGNLPLVGWADLLAVVIAGHKALVKLSSQDEVLMKAVIGLLKKTAPELGKYVEIIDRLENPEAVIATGGNNSARYFNAYFGKYPHIIRTNRNSLAVLTGQETANELKALGDDVCLYFGLGCRSVSCLLVPDGYDISALAHAWLPYSSMVDHHKYAGNLDYHKAIFLMNLDKFFDMGVMLLREDNRLYSPLSVLNLVYYSSLDQANDWIKEHEDALQVVVGSTDVWQNALPLGQAQYPRLMDYADGVDTLEWLDSLG